MSKKYYSGGEEIASKEYVDGQIVANTIQYSIMPVASDETVGKIIQYVGETDANYTNGYFYVGVSDEQNPATYSWENMPVQDGDGNLNLHWIWQGYPDDSVGIIDFSAMSRGIYLLSNLFCYRNGSAGSITYKKKNGSTTNLTIDTGGTAFNYASRAIYITMPVSEISSTSSFGVIGSIDIVDLTDGTVHNRRLKYYPSDGTVALTKETKTPIIHYLTEVAQTITGVKTFDSIPQVSSYTAPTLNTQLTAKKYVDDKIAAIPAGVEAIQVPVTLLDITPSMTSEQIVQCLGGQSNVNKLLDAFTYGKPIFGTAIDYGSYVQLPLTITLIDASGEGNFIFFGATVNNEIWEMNLNYSSSSGWTALSVTRTPLIKATTIAPLYNETSTYNVGDYCIYRDDGQLYKCTTAITVAEPFTVAHWAQTTIMGELGNINTVLSALTTPSNGGGN